MIRTGGLVNLLDRVYKKRFSVKVGQHLKLIATEDIEYFYSEIRAPMLVPKKTETIY